MKPDPQSVWGAYQRGDFETMAAMLRPVETMQREHEPEPREDDDAHAD